MLFLMRRRNEINNNFIFFTDSKAGEQGRFLQVQPERKGNAPFRCDVSVSMVGICGLLLLDAC